jgi:hypothetical protein
MQFLLGDMNWRIDQSYEKAVNLANKNKLADLLTHDQLLNYKSQYPQINRFKEGPLLFKPTYKYDEDSDVYDSGKKMRVPSWTDRILYKPDQCLLKYYNRREHRFSDHRPVLAIFECEVKNTNKELKAQIQ